MEKNGQSVKIVPGPLHSFQTGCQISKHRASGAGTLSTPEDQITQEKGDDRKGGGQRWTVWGKNGGDPEKNGGSGVWVV